LRFWTFFFPLLLLDQRNAQTLELSLAGGGEPGIAAQSRSRDHAAEQEARARAHYVPV